MDSNERRKALQRIHELERERNQQNDTWKVPQPRPVEEHDYGGFLKPLQKPDLGEYFSGTKKVKLPKDQKRNRSISEVVLLDDGKIMELRGHSSSGAHSKQVVTNLPIRSKPHAVPSKGLPFAPGPPISNDDNPWMQRGGTALFAEVKSHTLTAYGMCHEEEEAIALAIAESIRTAKEEQHLKIHMKELYAAQTSFMSIEEIKPSPVQRPPPDPIGTVWDSDEENSVEKGSSIRIKKSSNKGGSLPVAGGALSFIRRDPQKNLKVHEKKDEPNDVHSLSEKSPNKSCSLSTKDLRKPLPQRAPKCSISKENRTPQDSFYVDSGMLPENSSHENSNTPSGNNSSFSCEREESMSESTLFRENDGESTSNGGLKTWMNPAVHIDPSPFKNCVDIAENIKTSYALESQSEHSHGFRQTIPVQPVDSTAFSFTNSHAENISSQVTSHYNKDHCAMSEDVGSGESSAKTMRSDECDPKTASVGTGAAGEKSVRLPRSMPSLIKAMQASKVGLLLDAEVPVMLQMKEQGHSSTESPYQGTIKADVTNTTGPEHVTKPSEKPLTENVNNSADLVTSVNPENPMQMLLQGMPWQNTLVPQFNNGTQPFLPPFVPQLCPGFNQTPQMMSSVESHLAAQAHIASMQMMLMQQAMGRLPPIFNGMPPMQQFQDGGSFSQPPMPPSFMSQIPAWNTTPASGPDLMASEGTGLQGRAPPLNTPAVGKGRGRLSRQINSSGI